MAPRRQYQVAPRELLSSSWEPGHGVFMTDDVVAVDFLQQGASVLLDECEVEPR
jgi:hypothetical protein